MDDLHKEERSRSSISQQMTWCYCGHVMLLLCKQVWLTQ